MPCCWMLIEADGTDYENWDGVPHYPSEDEARAEAARVQTERDERARKEGEAAPAPLVARRLSAVCVSSPDCEQCGESLDDTPIHYLSVEEALDIAVVAADWYRIADRVWCPKCLTAPEVLADQERREEERVRVAREAMHEPLWPSGNCR